MILSSVLVLLLIGLVSGISLAIAAKVFKVQENPKALQMLQALPGINCGGCGYPGCEGYALAVLNKPSVQPDLCIAAGQETADVLAEVSDKTVERLVPLKAFCFCSKNDAIVKIRFAYTGNKTCFGVNSFYNGTDACIYSCLGHGDCIKSCKFNALRVKQDLIEIDKSRCTGCGACISACPRQVLQLEPVNIRVIMACLTKDKGKSVSAACDVGCISCLRCVKACPAEAVSKPGTIYIQQDKCIAYGSSCNQVCVTVCPKKILKTTP